MTPMLVAVDHFAGTGWGVACHWLGIREYGVEIMPEAIRTRRAVGFRTIYRDVWSGHEHLWLVPQHDLYIASPPCQTFSVAGRGEGRKALDQVLKLIDEGAWKRPAQLRQAGAALGDDRTALVLTPLAHIWTHRPRMVALEQVPTVLPVWEAIADVLRGLGYSVWTGNLQAEQYGVPQTRKRAILMARLDGPVSPPVPTHSRYYSRDPKRLDAGVLPWVSMADALGYRGFELVGNQVPRGNERGGYHSRPSTAPAQTVTGQAGLWFLRSNYSTGSVGNEIPEGNRLPRTEREIDQPASTITSKDGSMSWHRRGLASRPSPTITGGGTETGGAEPIAKLDRYVTQPDWVGGKQRLSVEEAALLQSYPRLIATKKMGRGMVERYGDRPGRGIDEPAFTIRASAGGAEPGGFVFTNPSDGATRKLATGDAAAFQSYPIVYRNGNQRKSAKRELWMPAPTILFGHNSNKVEWMSADLADDTSASGVRVSQDEAATFQTYPTPDEWADFALSEPVYA